MTILFTILFSTMILLLFIYSFKDILTSCVKCGNIMKPVSTVVFGTVFSMLLVYMAFMVAMVLVNFSRVLF